MLTKNFEHMDDHEKLAHIKELKENLPTLLKEYLQMPIADVYDWDDYWIPWLIEKVEEALE